MIGKRELVASALVLLVAPTPVITSMAPASGASGNTLVLSGQSKGKVTINKSETCSAGNISTAGPLTTVRIYLTDKDVAPIKDTWYVLVSSTSKKAAFPSSLDTFALGANRGISTDYEWITNSKLGAGTVVFGAKYKSGTINVTLAPGPNQKGATHSEKVVGSWFC